jgi:hypothetical protein
MTTGRPSRKFLPKRSASRPPAPGRTRRRLRFAPATLALAVLTGAPAGGSAGDLSLLVPAYFEPGTGGAEGRADGWAQLAEAAGKVGITAIFNPNDGPDSIADPSYVAALSEFRLAGGKVVAYIDTAYGSLPISAAEGQIAAYLEQYPGLIDGFFLDAMSRLDSEEKYYQQLYRDIKSESASYRVIGNPGVNTAESYLSAGAADSLVTFEQSAASYRAAAPASWTRGYSAAAFGNLIYGESAASGMMGDIALAQNRGVEYVYVTDETMNPATGDLYTRLPSYWNAEAAAVGAEMPEPSSLVLMASGLLAVAAAMRLGRWPEKRAVPRAIEQPALLPPRQDVALLQLRRD